MRIGCVVTPDDWALAGELGFDYVELSGRSVAALTGAEFKALLRQGADSVPCLGLNAYCPPEVRVCGPGFDPAVAREYALQVADRAAELGARVIGVGSPQSRNLPDGYDRARAWDEALRFFDLTARAFAPFGICVCVEALGPCYSNFINHLAEAAAMAADAGAPNLGVVLDYYNMEHSGEAALDLMPYMPLIRHVHMSDDDGGDPSRRWFFREDKLFLHRARTETLTALGYRGSITIEIDPRIDAALARRSLAALRGAT